MDAVFGTALISDRPGLSAAVKEVSKRRRQFLKFFVSGRALGDSILRLPVQAFVRSHQLPDELLVIVLNDQSDSREILLESNLNLWLPPSRKYLTRYYGSEGKVVWEAATSETEWTGTTKSLDPLELAYFEIRLAQ